MKDGTKAEYLARLAERTTPTLGRCSGPSCTPSDANGKKYGTGGLLCLVSALDALGRCVSCAKADEPGEQFPEPLF